MKKGMLTTLSALPVVDTENHHHTTIRKGKGNCPVSCPHRLQQTLHSLLKTYGEGPGLFYGSGRDFSSRKNPSPNSSLVKLAESLLFEYNE